VFAAWLALIALMLTSLASAYVPMGPWNLVAGLAIATVKSLVVLTVFMGLLRGPALLRIAAAIGFAMLALLVSLAGIDYATRIVQPAPIQQPQQLHRPGGPP
jgi:caa(3)-type oxidase subunit IV